MTKSELNNDVDKKLAEVKHAFEEAQEAQTAARKLAESLTKDDIGSIFRALMAETQGVESITWSQYTPYFNDGDPCVFGIHLEYMTLRKESPLGILFSKFAEESGKDLKYYSDSDVDNPPELITIACYTWSKYLPKQVNDFIDKVEDTLQKSEAILLHAIGDHMRVVVSSNGVIVEEAYHS